MGKGSGGCDRATIVIDNQASVLGEPSDSNIETISLTGNDLPLSNELYELPSQATSWYEYFNVKPLDYKFDNELDTIENFRQLTNPSEWVSLTSKSFYRFYAHYTKSSPNNLQDVVQFKLDHKSRTYYISYLFETDKNILTNLTPLSYDIDFIEQPVIEDSFYFVQRNVDNIAQSVRPLLKETLNIFVEEFLNTDIRFHVDRLKAYNYHDQIKATVSDLAWEIISYRNEPYNQIESINNLYKELNPILKTNLLPAVKSYAYSQIDHAISHGPYTPEMWMMVIDDFEKFIASR